MASKMHFGVVFLNGPTQHSIGEWRVAENQLARGYTTMGFWQNIGRILERGKFDMVFFADILGTYDSYEHSIDTTVQYSVQFPVHDPMPLIPAIVSATEKIGVAATHSTTYDHPYALARTFATLVHLTEGRVGWNVVSSSHPNEAADFGLDGVMDHDERYERAEEYVQVCSNSGRVGSPTRSSWTLIPAPTPTRRRCTTSTTRASTSGRAARSTSRRHCMACP
jgi:alkanesulfonate monooxygenase SsuD/methylene tetrahydromethanopterin reductase-like flavin-dependent oxidoreductase (luciferase family)